MRSRLKILFLNVFRVGRKTIHPAFQSGLTFQEAQKSGVFQVLIVCDVHCLSRR